MALPSGFRFLSTLLYLIYCVGYRCYSHLCNRFLVTALWMRKCAELQKWKNDYGMSIVLKELMSTGLHTVIELSPGNFGNTKEHD